MTDKQQRMEMMIVKTIIEDALDLGYNVVLHDGEDYAAEAVAGSFNGKESEVTYIMSRVGSTDEQSLFFRKGQNVGSVQLVFGNDGYDVVSDYTDNDEVNAILAGAAELAEKMEAGVI
jgi:hypothetical protein